MFKKFRKDIAGADVLVLSLKRQGLSGKTANKLNRKRVVAKRKEPEAQLNWQPLGFIKRKDSFHK